MPNAGTPDFSDLEGGENQQAHDAVQAVVAWYAAVITAEHRAPVPDQDRIEELKTGREAALADQARLATADPRAVAQVAAVYATLLKELLIE